MAYARAGPKHHSISHKAHNIRISNSISITAHVLACNTQESLTATATLLRQDGGRPRWWLRMRQQGWSAAITSVATSRVDRFTHPPDGPTPSTDLPTPPPITSNRRIGSADLGKNWRGDFELNFLKVYYN